MKSRLAVLLFACSALSAQQIYDLLLKNGRVIDPANHRDAQLDVAVTGNRIVRVAPNLPAAHARVAVDVSGYTVTPGLIDLNTHFGPELKPDYNTLPNGVTTAVDAGTATCETFPGFKTRVIDRAKTRVLAFLSATDAGCTSRVARQNPETIAGIAATPSTLEAALEAAQASGSVIMFGGGSQPYESYATLLAKLRPGDVGTHVYSRLTPPMDSNGKLRPEVLEAQRRGVLFDSALGTDGLWFRIAQPAVAQKLLPDTISSGMDWQSILLPRANMATSMSIFLNLGMTEEQIVERVTSNAARAIKRPQLGALSEGAVADIAVLEVQEGKFGFLDSGHARLDATRRFRCLLTVRNGVIVWDSDGLSIPDTVKAGPYTNFK
ncbi:MAG: amidohydrolase family protein [Bryobacteraceae bacterium]